MKNLKNKILLPISMACCVLMLGCKLEQIEFDSINTVIGDPNTNEREVIEHPPLGAYCDERTYYQPDAQISKKIDMLFIIDTSGSIVEERAKIAEGMEAFFNALPNDIDMQVGVMLAHAQSAFSGQLYRKYSNQPLFFSNTTFTIEEIKSQLSKRMANAYSERISDGGEAGLYSIDKALSPTRLEEIRRQGFFRKDAGIVLTFVADENDICYRYPEGVKPAPDHDNLEASAFDQFCTNVTYQSVHKKIKDTFANQPLLVSGILYNENSVFPHTGENEIGHGYLDLIQLFSGAAIDLSDERYHIGLDKLANLAIIKLNLITEYPLNLYNIQIKEMFVKVDGVSVPFNYVSETSTVHLTHYAGHENSQIYIAFCEEDPDSGTDPGTDDPGTEPGTDDPGTEPGTDDPGTEPGTDDPGTEPGTDDPGTEPGEEEPIAINSTEVINLTGTSIKVVWTTNIDSYSMMTVVDLNTGQEFISNESSVKSTSHVHEVFGLTPNSLYKLIPKNRTDSQPYTQGEELVFRTRR